MTCYKLLSQDMEANGYRWTLGQWVMSDALGNFCPPGGFRGYEHPLLAILHNPIHDNIPNPRMFEAVADGKSYYDGRIQLMAQWMMLIREIPVPAVTLEQRVAYGIYCAKAVYSAPWWNEWADAWLSGADRIPPVVFGEEEWSTTQVPEEPPGQDAVAAEWAMRSAGSARRAIMAEDEQDAEALAGMAARQAALAAVFAARAGVIDIISCAERAMGAVEL